MPSKHSSDRGRSRDQSRGRPRHRSSSRSRSDGRSKEQRFIDNWNAFMKSYSHEYTNGYYTGPKSYHPDYPDEPKVLSGDAPRRRIPKAIAYNNDDDGYDSGPDTGKGKGKGRAHSRHRSRSHSRHSRSRHSRSGYTVPPHVPDPPYYPGYVPTYAQEDSHGYSGEYYPYPKSSGYDANGPEHYTLNGASVFNAVHPSDMAGPSSSDHDHSRAGHDYSRGRTRHREDTPSPSYDYDRDYSRGARPSSIYSNAPFGPYSRSTSCVPSYISGRSYSQPASRSHSRCVEDISYGSGSYYSSGVSYGGANIVNAEHPDDIYRSTSRQSSPTRHLPHQFSHHRSHSNGSRHRSRSLHHSRHHSSHRSHHRSPSRHHNSHRSRHGSPSRRHHRSHRSGHRSGHHSGHGSRHGSSSRRRHRSHRHHHHHHSRPRGSSRYVEESYYSSRTSRKGKKRGGFLEKVKDLFH